ncbi:MAG: MFS transporter [Oligoflexia bacterium]|nr:MFS transporter [Oligoflexia bacterium]
MVIIALEQYYLVFTAPFLKQTGIREYLIMPIMSLAQIAEIVTMYMLAKLIRRYGYMRVFIIGVLAESVRFTCYSLDSGIFSVIFAQIVHGLAFVFVTIASVIYLDKFCDEKIRSGVMLLYGIFTIGMGNIIGNLFAGKTGDYFFNPSTQTINFSHLFLVLLSRKKEQMLKLLHKSTD